VIARKNANSPHCFEEQNPASAAVQRELTEDWGC
jgi:hypothetical protein